MRRRLIVAAVGAVALILLMAAPAFARHGAAAAEPYGWDLQLRNTVSTQYSADMTYKAFATWAASHQATVVDNNKTADDTADDVTYKGVSLKTLVGYFDDQDPATFNTALATAGYNVVVLGMDGFTGTFASADIASLGDKVILANLAGGQPLAVPPATLSSTGAASWKPNWPLKVVSNDSSVTGKMKPGGVVRVSILSATAPNQPAEPFAWDLQLRNTMTAKYGADMTSAQWAAWAAKAGRTVTITDSTEPTATVAYKGVSLKTIVGYFDDKNRNTFNAALAKKGYWVVILGMDGFWEAFKGADIAQLGNKLIVASLGNDAPLPVPKPYLNAAGQPTWTPDWPLRVVSNVPAIKPDTQTEGIVRISIVKKLPVGLAPF
jgi:hypothetical protein